MKKALMALVLPVLFATAVHAEGEAKYTRWKLDFTRGDMGYVLVNDALGKPQVSYYLTFAVKNGNDRDVPLRIRVTASTDTKQTYRGSIGPMFQRALETKTGKKYKTALDIGKGTIAAGESLDCVVFFGQMDPNLDVLTIRVYGLFDTIEQIKGQLYFEKKVLVLTYERLGDEFGSLADPIEFKKSEWVIEGERVLIEQPSPWGK